MFRICGILMFLTVGSAVNQDNIPAQNSSHNANSASQILNSSCDLTGVYRIDATESDKLYSVVKDATSKAAPNDQQKIFIDLTIRLTPPDMLALECRGNRISVGSSRSPRVTFIADGKMRRERNSEGELINSRIGLEKDVLTFSSEGKNEDNVSVTFKSVENGQRLRVTRHIYADQLTEPIIIQTVYNRIADAVDWDNYGESQVARQTQREDQRPEESEPQKQSAAAETDEAGRLRNLLNRWIEATNALDVEKQMSFYMPELKAFYLARNVSESAVRREKIRIFSAANSVDIRAEEPEIIFQDAGRTAIMRFRKKYKIVEKKKTRAGEVVQELRWQKTGDAWRIFSERDIKVIR